MVAGGGVVVACGGGGVMMVSCGHAELLVWNLTSARCNQSLARKKLNCKISTRWVDSPYMQYLTRCSQMKLAATTCRLLGFTAGFISRAVIPHSKQENATTSAASTPV